MNKKSFGARIVSILAMGQWNYLIPPFFLIANPRFSNPFFCLLLLILSACAGDPLEGAREEGWSRHEIAAPPFRLFWMERGTSRATTPVIYIEGDGRAWINRATPSLNPTPRQALAFDLARRDPSPHVIYLARPCQYVEDPACSVAYWTDKRLAPEIIAATSHAIDSIVGAGRDVHLVGFSGGGGLAALVAATRGRVASLRTVAGNLDSEGLNRHHDVSPMPASLNPLSIASRLSTVPQIHYVGIKDDVVPLIVAERFLEKAAPTPCARIVPIPEVAHLAGWKTAWPNLLKEIPTLLPCFPALP